MTACLIDRHRTEIVDRAHELHLLFPVEINQGEELESAEREQRANHVLIFGAGGSLLFRAGADRIRPAAAKRFCEELSIRCNNQRLKTFDGNLISGLHDRPFTCRGRSVAVEPFLVHRFDLVPATIKPVYRHHLRERSKPAHMIGVVVTDHQVVNLLQAGLLRGRMDSFGVPVIDLETGVNQHRFPRRRHDQRGCSAFDVYPIDVQISGLRLEHRRRKKQQRQNKEPHHNGLLVLHSRSGRRGRERRPAGASTIGSTHQALRQIIPDDVSAAVCASKAKRVRV